eukprot:TRINITY_DN14625_c0_g1_i1.p1 TRINITY_DN14625_c0_g1~~TRINITY_DN14625_c0_g1_i1.p1  ORF type:complete len:1662 (+),score=393.86 TRINITY_DN14625_c0_g1_i1:98-4987(+)
MPRHGARIDDQDFRSKAIAEKIRVGEALLPDLIKLEKPHKARQGPTVESLLATAGIDGEKSGGAGQPVLTVLSREDEVRISRALDALLEAYRRFARPEKSAHSWAADKWGLIAQFLGKLRTLASQAHWTLPPPLKHLCRDPKALAETGLEDPLLAAPAVDLAEGAIEARLLRIAARLVVSSSDRGSTEVAQSWLSPETRTLARMCLAHVRNVGDTLVHFLDEAEPHEVLLPELHQNYCALASGLHSMRERLSKEVHHTLRVTQAPLEAAASAAARLGLGSARGGSEVTLSPDAVAFERGLQPLATFDPYLSVDQGALLSIVASFAEVADRDLPDAEACKQLGRSDTAAERAAHALAVEMGDEDPVVKKLNWPVEFTEVQLRQMQKCLSSKNPQVDGVLSLMEDTIKCYARVAEAMGGAFSDSSVLRAGPVSIVRNKPLLSLVKELRELWRHAGATIATQTRTEDLLALDKVRVRHKEVVNRAFREGGHDAAAVVLARLALVDEMLEPPEKRKLTGDVQWDLQRHYNTVASVLSALTQTDSMHERRRRRWLYCPHNTVYTILGGEVWRQTLRRFNTVETAFDALAGCASLPLSQREFRIALCLLELSMNESLSVLLYEGAAHIAGSSQADMRSFLSLVLTYGAKGTGDTQSATKAAAALARLEARIQKDKQIAQQSKQKQKTVGRARRRSVQGDQATAQQQGEAKVEGAAAETAVAKKPFGPLTVCKRCMCNDLPHVPFVSISELQKKYVSSLAQNENKEAEDAKVEAGKQSPKARLQGEAAEAAEKARQEQELSEDATLAWATATLAADILLVNDERGAYFKWLSRIVMYGVTSSEAEKNSSPRPSPKPANRRGSARRTSLQGLQATVTRSDSAANSPTGNKSLVNFAMEEAPPAAYTPPSLQTEMEELENEEETRRLQELDLSLYTLSNFRQDLGLSTLVAAGRTSTGPDSGSAPLSPTSPLAGSRAGFDRQTTQDSTMSSMPASPQAAAAQPAQPAAPSAPASGFSVRSSVRKSKGAGASILGIASVGRLFSSNAATGGSSIAKKMKRRSRESRIVVGLRNLNVPEELIAGLVKELQAIPGLPNLNGSMLCGGAARAAVGILLRSSPNGRVPPVDDSAEDTPWNCPGGWQVLLPESATKVLATTSRGVAAIASAAVQQVLEKAQSSAQRCYSLAGFDQGSDRLAVAIRLMEHEMFPGNEDIPAVSEAASAAAAAKSVGIGQQPLAITIGAQGLPTLATSTPGRSVDSIVRPVQGLDAPPTRPPRGSMDLRSGDMRDGHASTEEITTELAPLLLPRSASSRVLAQVREEQEVTAQAAAAAAEAAAPPQGRRASLVIFTGSFLDRHDKETRGQSSSQRNMQQSLVSESGSNSSLSSGAEDSGEDSERRPSCRPKHNPGSPHGATSSSRSEASAPISISSSMRQRMRPRSPLRGSHLDSESTAMGKELRQISERSAAASKEWAMKFDADESLTSSWIRRKCRMEEEPEDHYNYSRMWDPAVRSLMSSVDIRAGKMRYTTNGQGFQSRSATMLPNIHRPKNGAHGAATICSRAGPYRVRDLLPPEGWRAERGTAPKKNHPTLHGTSYGSFQRKLLKGGATASAPALVEDIPAIAASAPEVNEVNLLRSALK